MTEYGIESELTGERMRNGRHFLEKLHFEMQNISKTITVKSKIIVDI